MEEATRFDVFNKTDGSLQEKVLVRVNSRQEAIAILYHLHQMDFKWMNGDKIPFNDRYGTMSIYEGSKYFVVFPNKKYISCSSRKAIAKHSLLGEVKPFNICHFNTKELKYLIELSYTTYYEDKPNKFHLQYISLLYSIFFRRYEGAIIDESEKISLEIEINQFDELIREFCKLDDLHEPSVRRYIKCSFDQSNNKSINNKKDGNTSKNLQTNDNSEREEITGRGVKLESSGIQIYLVRGHSEFKSRVSESKSCTIRVNESNPLLVSGRNGS